MGSGGLVSWRSRNRPGGRADIAPATDKRDSSASLPLWSRPELAQQPSWLAGRHSPGSLRKSPLSPLGVGPAASRNSRQLSSLLASVPGHFSLRLGLRDTPGSYLMAHPFLSAQVQTLCKPEAILDRAMGLLEWGSWMPKPSRRVPAVLLSSRHPPVPLPDSIPVPSLSA